MGFTKAVLKGLLVPEDSIPIPFLFNPTVLGDDTKSTNYARINPLAKGSPTYHFVNGGARTLSFEITLNDDILKAGSLELYTGLIRDLQYPKKNIGLLKQSPPVILFIFGPMLFNGVIVKTTIKRTKFDPFLLLKEATLAIDFEEISEGESFLGYTL